MPLNLVEFMQYYVIKLPLDNLLRSVNNKKKHYINWYNYLQLKDRQTPSNTDTIHLVSELRLRLTEHIYVDM